MPWARAMLGLAPVARREQPFSVPKNQYKTAMSTTVNTTSRGRGLSIPTVRTYRWDTSRSYLSTPTAWFALLPMIRRLMEYRDSWVRMPARMAGMPHFVWNRPVTKPASIPARNAHSRAAQALTPARISMTATAPPVAREPSTVKSATSRIRNVM